LVDGGVWANNPAMVAVTETFGTLHVPLEHTWLLSIGTYDPVERRPASLNKGGVAFWAKSATGIILRAGSIGVNNQVRYLLGPDHVLRVDPKVPPADVVLDRTKGTSGLIARARHYSRVFMPAIHEKFVQHKAVLYTPLYS
jgi:hypothetical protein